LTYAFKQFTKSKTLFGSIQKLQDETICWVFNLASNKIKVLNGILGALTVEQRFSHLRCSFQLHLNHSASDNPIRALISSSPFTQYLCYLRSNGLYNEFTTLPGLPTNYTQLKKRMTTFLLSRRSGIISHSSGVLVNYIPTTSHTASLIDKVLLSPVHFQRMFLSWRRSLLFLNTTCICKERWHSLELPQR